MSYEHKLRVPAPWRVSSYAVGQLSGPYRADDGSQWYAIPVRNVDTGTLRVEVFRLPAGADVQADGTKLLEHVDTPELDGFEAAVSLSRDGRLRMVVYDADTNTLESAVIDGFVGFGGLT